LFSVAISIEQSSDINSNVDSRQYAFKELSPWKSGNSESSVTNFIFQLSTAFQERSR